MLGTEVEGELRFLLPKNAGEPEVIIVGQEYLSAIVAARDNVIEPSADFDPWFARHGGVRFIDAADEMSTNSSLTPSDAELATHVIGAETSGNAVRINTQGPFRETTIAVRLPDGRIEFRTVDFNAGISSGAQFGSLLLLHELGHRTGVFKPDRDNPELNRAQTQQVLDACFK